MTLATKQQCNKKKREREREEEDAGGRRNAARVRCFSEDTGIFEDI